MGAPRIKQTIAVAGIRIPKWKDCPECGTKNSCGFMLYAYMPRCPKCQKKRDKELQKQEKLEGKIVLNTHSSSSKKEVVGFMKNRKTGEMVGIDAKGGFVRPSETIYDLKHDPHGWNKIGRKVRPTDKYGRPNR